MKYDKLNKMILSNLYKKKPEPIHVDYDDYRELYYISYKQHILFIVPYEELKIKEHLFDKIRVRSLLEGMSDTDNDYTYPSNNIRIINGIKCRELVNTEGIISYVNDDYLQYFNDPRVYFANEKSPIYVVEDEEPSSYTSDQLKAVIMPVRA